MIRLNQIFVCLIVWAGARQSRSSQTSLLGAIWSVGHAPLSSSTAIWSYLESYYVVLSQIMPLEIF